MTHATFITTMSHAATGFNTVTIKGESIMIRYNPDIIKIERCGVAGMNFYLHREVFETLDGKFVFIVYNEWDVYCVQKIDIVKDI